MTLWIRKVIRFFLVFLIRSYQVLLSPIMGKDCRYTPTCSEYALEALRTHGLLEALTLTVKRIGRCHPWAKSCCYDPVPENRKDS